MAQSKQERRARNIAHWGPHIRRFQTSNQSASVYCHENKLNVHQFRYWQYELAPTKKVSRVKTPTPLSFMEVKTLPTVNVSTDFELQLPSGYRIMIPAEFNAEVLRRLLTVIG